jgi:DNA-directed RNA polymerase specialized sigma24 family protein
MNSINTTTESSWKNTTTNHCLTSDTLHSQLRSYRQRRLNIEKLKHAGADTSQHEQQLERLLSGILAVPNPANQQCLIDRYIRGEPVITIAVRLGVTEGTVYNRLSAGRAELLRILS